METLIYSIIAAVAGVTIGFFLLRAVSKKSGHDESSLLLLQKQIDMLAQTLERSAGESRRDIQQSVAQQMSFSQKIMESMTARLMDVQKGLSESTHTSKQVLTIADQLQNLEKVLTHQKQRGNLGEASLELILGNMLPPTVYELQYRFENGDMVDAVITTKEGVIPVDAKFSLDNYLRLLRETDTVRREGLEREFKNDLKKRIDETAKYIRPKEKTLPFAFMYIPAEGIYYDLLVNEVGAVKVNTRSLLEYAYHDKHVIIVSPTTFAAYLQSVLYGFKAFKVEESAKEIARQVEKLSGHLRAYDDYFKKVGIALNTTVNHYDRAQKELQKVDKDVLKITGSPIDVETLALERPQADGS